MEGMFLVDIDILEDTVLVEGTDQEVADNQDKLLQVDAHIQVAINTLLVDQEEDSILLLELQEEDNMLEERHKAIKDKPVVDIPEVDTIQVLLHTALVILAKAGLDSASIQCTLSESELFLLVFLYDGY